MARADNFYTVVDKIKEILLQDNNDVAGFDATFNVIVAQDMSVC